MLGLHLFKQAMFERAGDYLLRGKIDPRLVVRSFSSLRGKTIGSAEEVEVYEGLRDVLEDMGDIDSIGESQRHGSLVEAQCTDVPQSTLPFANSSAEKRNPNQNPSSL